MRTGLVGAGAIAALRKQAIDKTEGAEFAGVFDIDAAKAAALAGGARVYQSLEEMLADPGVGAVVISTPPDIHERIAVAALVSGKHVIVEKPMANSLDACRRMIEKARETGRVLTVGFNHRYFPAIKELKAAVASGALGRLAYVRGFAGHTGLKEFKSPWMYSKDVMGGGALLDNGIHMIDLVHYVMGDIDGVYGRTSGEIWGLDRVEDTAFALLTGKNNVIGSLNASWTEWKGYHFYIEAYGDRGMARAYYAPMRFSMVTMDKPGGAPTRKNNFYLSTIVREKLKGWQYTAVNTLAEEIADFMTLAGGQKAQGPIASAVDGYRSIEIANAVYRANESGRVEPLAATV